MERLTTRNLLDCATLKSIFDVKTIDYWDEIGDARSAKAGPAIDLLAAYEDTGLTPEEITANMEMFAAYRHVCDGLPPEKIEQMLQDERDGHLAVLPCKAGDTVYDAYTEVFTDEKIVSDDRKFGELHIAILCNGVVEDTVPLSEIGKTVFLARSEAEKSLGGAANAL